jgi:polysaccharide biosynthesis transport protein
MNAEQNFQPLRQIDTLRPDEDSEGGLDLGQVLSAIRRKIFLIAGITTVVTAAALAKALTDTPTYSATFEILTQPVTAETQVISSIPQTFTSKEDTSQKGLDETKLKVLNSSSVIAPIVQQLKPQYPDITYGSIASGLKISVLGTTNILEVSYVGTDQEQVKAVLNAVAKAYLNYSLQSRQTDILHGIQFVEAQLPDLRKRVDDLQWQLQQLRQRYNLVDPDSRGQQLSTQISTFTQQRLTVQAELAQARALYADLDQQLTSRSGETVASSALTSDSRYQALLNQLLAIDSQIAEKSSLFLEESPDIQVLREQRQNLLPLLTREGLRVQQELSGHIRELEASDKALLQTVDSLNLNVNQLSTISRQYTDIQRELQIATENLSQFLIKREALRIDAAQRETPWELLTPPGDPQPSAASAKKNLVMGLILGILLGVGVALILDKFSSILYTVKDIRRMIGLPILGVIPFNEEMDRVLASEDLSVFRTMDFLQTTSRFENQDAFTFKPYKTAPFTEAFRSLTTNIRLLNPDAPIRSLVVCSTIPGEGKSTVSAHLAYAAAALGQRVLLVDTDLRHPQIHHRLGLANTEGLTDVVTANRSLKETIQQSPLESNLFVLTAGSIPPDSTKVISSQKMKDLMEQANAIFDLVIYDTPPLLTFADPLLIAAQTNGILLVARLGKLKRHSLEQAIAKLEVSGTNVLGIVPNGDRDESSNSFDNYYHIKPSSEKALPQSSGISTFTAKFTSRLPRLKK